MQPILEKNIDNIKALCKTHYIKKMYVFGSAVSGDFNENSDVDLLYEMDYSGYDFENIKENTYNPFLVFFDLKEKLEALFGTKVDLVPNQDFKNIFFVNELEKTKTLIYG
jgi:uncharacterized protein